MRDQVKLETDGSLDIRANLFLDASSVQHHFKIAPSDVDYINFINHFEQYSNPKSKLISEVSILSIPVWEVIIGVATLSLDQQISILVRKNTGTETETYNYNFNDSDYNRLLEILGPMTVGVQRPVGSWMFAGTIEMLEDGSMHMHIRKEYDYDGIVPRAKDIYSSAAVDEPFYLKLQQTYNLKPGQKKLVQAKGFAHPDSWVVYR